MEKSGSNIVGRPQTTKEEKSKQEFDDLDWLASLSPEAEEELFNRYTIVPEITVLSMYNQHMFL